MSVMNATLRAWGLAALLVGCGETFAVSLGSHATGPADPSDAGSEMDIADATAADPDASGETDDPELDEDESEADEEPDAEDEEGSEGEEENGDPSP